MRSHFCGELNESNVDEDVVLCGWIHRRRDHGGVIFLDLRDREGLAQVVYDPDTKESFKIAEGVRNEFVVEVKGRVRLRPSGTINDEMPTGRIEILGNELKILNASETPPIQLDEHAEVGEDIRLKYRYIDLRRPEMAAKLRFRSKVGNTIRNFLDNNGFLDIETPLLTKATPEGARDYLVPSRTHQGRFFALPQSPQLFKQILMASGMDRYYQIAKCFRDEDLRADRQPEFTQIDVETSFMDEDQIMGLDKNERETFMKEIGLNKTGLNQLIKEGYELLNLDTFFTSGPEESRAWTVEKNTLAPKAASVIHTDFEKNFIRAEAVTCEDFIKFGSAEKCKENGKLRIEGKDYIVKDGDVLYFRVNP